MSTLKTNNIQHVDRSDPSILINTDGSVSIAGTMTYEDVTNVDSVGIITGRELINAQKQVHVGTGVSVKAGGINVTAGITTVQALQATTGTFSDDVTFTGASNNIVFDKSDNALEFADNAKVTFGTGADMTIKHDGSNSEIVNTTGSLLIDGQNALTLRSAGNLIGQVNDSETTFQGIANGAFEAYFDNSKKLETTSTGVSFLDGNITNVGSIAVDSIKGDADDNTNITFATNDVIYFKCGSTSPALTVNTTQVKVEDNQKFVAGTGNDLQIYSNGAAGYIDHVTTGTGADLILRSKTFVVRNLSDETMIVGNQNGAVNLYHNDTIRFSTTGNGADVFGNGASNNYFKLINTSGTSNASHHMTIDTYNAGGYWSDLKIDASNIQLNTYTGNRATLSNNALTFASGVNIVMANGQGIDFSAATDSGSGETVSGSVLNDYEYGTWVPSNSTVGFYNDDSLGGTYTKIGNRVFFDFLVRFNSNSSSVVAYIDGLPFTSAGSGSNYDHGATIYYTTDTSVRGCLVGNNATRLYIYDTGGSGMNSASLSNDYLRGSGMILI